ncbi:PAS sensor protein [Thiothrix nivea DSM 5205]|uniref:PAS sensor protein n=2 Tax=Thiothrix nivea TaxID=1031 RepID=A0A656HIZ4_THINJ|nr:PAS sensor protein [Thiothrix nivea DSM 5205]
MNGKLPSSLIRPDLLQTLIDHADHGISIAEREGDDTILLYVNEAFEKMTGYSAEECLFKDCRFLQGDDRDQPERSKIHNAILNTEPIQVVLRNYRKDGSMFWNELMVTPYFDETEGVTYYIGIQKDITELVVLKTELLACKKQLLEQQMDKKSGKNIL